MHVRNEGLTGKLFDFSSEILYYNSDENEVILCQSGQDIQV